MTTSELASAVILVALADVRKGSVASLNGIEPRVMLREVIYLRLFATIEVIDRAIRPEQVSVVRNAMALMIDDLFRSMAADQLVDGFETAKQEFIARSELYARAIAADDTGLRAGHAFAALVHGRNPGGQGPKERWELLQECGPEASRLGYSEYYSTFMGLYSWLKEIRKQGQREIKDF